MNQPQSGKNGCDMCQYSHSANWRHNGFLCECTCHSLSQVKNQYPEGCDGTKIYDPCPLHSPVSPSSEEKCCAGLLPGMSQCNDCYDGDHCNGKTRGCGQFTSPSQEGWVDEFERRGGEDLCVYPDDEQVLPADHLFRGDEKGEKWPENQYELDPDKVKNFIRQTLTQARAEAYERGFQAHVEEIDNLPFAAIVRIKAKARASTLKEVGEIADMLSREVQSEDEFKLMRIEKIVNYFQRFLQEKGDSKGGVV